MFSLPLTPEEPCCGSPCRGATGEGAVWDSQTSSVYWRCYDKVLFSLTIRTLCEQPRNTLSFGVSPISVTLSLPNMGQGTLSAFPVAMHLGVALRYLAPSCTAYMERNVAGEPREHMPRTGSVMLSSRMRNSMEEKGPLAEPACFRSGSLSVLLHQIREPELCRFPLKHSAGSFAPLIWRSSRFEGLSVDLNSRQVPFHSSGFSDLNHLHLAYTYPGFSDSKIHILDFYRQTVFKISSAIRQIQ